MPLAQFPVDRRRTAIAIQYTNEELISDIVLPRKPVGGERFDWKQYRLDEAFKRVDTLVGRTGQVQNVEFGFDMREGRTKDYGLQNPVPQKDIDNSGPGYDPLDENTEHITNWMLLDRELRVVNTVFNTNNYPAGNLMTLAGADQFSNYTIDPTTPATESDPIGVLEEAKSVMIAKPNMAIMGENTWGWIRRHPKMISAYHGNDGRNGLVPRAFFEEMFNMQLVVGSAWLDTNRPGMPANLSRLWDHDIALLRIDPTATVQSGMTWGLTAQWGARRTYNWFDQDIGLDGGRYVRVGEHLQEIVTAPMFGFLIKDVHP